MFENKEVKWLLSRFLSCYIDTTIGEITHLEREREGRMMITEEKKKNCLKRKGRQTLAKKDSKREQLSMSSLRMLLHKTNVDKEYDDDDDDDGDDANAHNLINAEKKRKILFFYNQD